MLPYSSSPAVFIAESNLTVVSLSAECESLGGGDSLERTMASGAAGCPRIKSEICGHKTTDGEIMFEDELLKFIVSEMRTLANDEIVLLVSNNKACGSDDG